MLAWLSVQLAVANQDVDGTIGMFASCFSRGYVSDLNKSHLI